MLETSLETETSALIARLRRPRLLISEHTFRASASRLTKFTATSAPACANAAAMLAPIPRLAPVTNAIFPSSSLLIKDVSCGLTPELHHHFPDVCAFE